MSSCDWMQIVLFMGLLFGLTPIFGRYMASLFSETMRASSSRFGILERYCYKIGGVDPFEEMTWKKYAKELLIFNLFGFILIFFLQILQGSLPLNPQNFRSPSLDLAFNTTSSFVTNTNWQAYSGETTLSYLTQMLGLTVQNFLSASTGLAVLLAFIRGIVRRNMTTIGNFWVDLTRSVLYFFLPLCAVFACVLLSQGVIQTLSPYVTVTTLEGDQQTIPLGPVASQIAIKQLGTNGGGFFGANSSHPFENPNSITNLLESLALLLIPAASVYMYGIFTHEKKHAWLLYGAMIFFFLGGVCISLYSQGLHNPVLKSYPVLEGIETRFGSTQSILWATATTATANGSVNTMISSLSPLAGGVAIFNLMLGELVFGGVGVGLCSMLMFTLLTVFLSGLMVGRTPEYLGKKIEKRTMQWVTFAVLLPGALILIGSGVSSVLTMGLTSLENTGPHGLTEILYAFSSCAANNGSAFAGLNANTPYYNLLLGIVMLLARLSIVIPSLAIAGQLAQQNISVVSAGTFSTNTFLFFILLVGVIFIVGALSFFPALCLGPIVEHFLMLEGQSF